MHPFPQLHSLIDTQSLTSTFLSPWSLPQEQEPNQLCSLYLHQTLTWEWRPAGHDNLVESQSLAYVLMYFLRGGMDCGDMVWCVASSPSCPNV